MTDFDLSKLEATPIFVNTSETDEQQLELESIKEFALELTDNEEDYNIMLNGLLSTSLHNKPEDEEFSEQIDHSMTIYNELADELEAVQSEAFSVILGLIVHEGDPFYKEQAAKFMKKLSGF